MQEKIETIKALSLKIDWNLWPRYQINNKLDSANLRKMEEALRAGIELPPLVIDADTNRIVDGFHRQTVFLKVYGEETEVRIIKKHYESEAEIFLDAVRLNNQHGLPLSPQDQIHAIIVLRERHKKIPWEKIAGVLGMTSEVAKKFYEERSATNLKGVVIPLSGGTYRALGGRKLNQAQTEYAERGGGVEPIVYLRMFIKALKAKAFPRNEKDIEALMELRFEIDEILNAPKKKAGGRRR